MDLQPRSVWMHFFEICRIPRCSGNEQAVRAYVLRQAALRGLVTREDRIGNLVVSKPAAPGREYCPLVVLQSHLDMVCEKNKDTVHDFRREPVRWVRVGEWIRAEGTTLGADNGVGVAAGLALMESRDVRHGPLEFLFTVDEESGLTGAFGLETGMLHGRILLNLDSEEEGAIYIGCAGGVFTDLSLRLSTEATPAGYAVVRIRVGGLQGGHSGLNIQEGRGNAIRLTTEILLAAIESLDLRLAGMDGGNKPNAIPRECDAVVCLPETQQSALEKIVTERGRAWQEQFREADPGVRIKLARESSPRPASVLGQADQQRLLALLQALPHGVMAMSATVPGMVETSTNLAVVRCEGGKVTIRTKQRSSSRTALLEISQRVEQEGKKAGAEAARSGEYPAWAPVPSSPILRHAGAVYRSLFGKEPEVKTIHAGLECGIIGDKFPGLDTISFGPTIVAPHSPEERVEIRSVERFWGFLTALLERLGPEGH